MNGRRFALAIGLIVAYLGGLLVWSAVFPSPDGEKFGDRLGVYYLLSSVVLLAVVAIIRGWRFTGLVGRDRIPAIRSIVVIAVLEIALLAAYFAICAADYGGKNGAMAMILINVGFVALNEELLFRGFLWGSLGGWSPARRILVTALIFGGSHAVNGFSGDAWSDVGVQVGLVAIGGILDGVIRYGTGSLWPTIIAHYLWDSGGLLGDGGFADSLGPFLQGAFNIAGIVALILIAARGFRGRGRGRDRAAPA